MTTRSVVVKVGTSSVTDSSGGVDYEVLVNIADDVVHLRDEGWSVVVVTSGAITAGTLLAQAISQTMSTASQWAGAAWAIRSAGH